MHSIGASDVADELVGYTHKGMCQLTPKLFGQLKGIGLPFCLRNRSFSVRIRGCPPNKCGSSPTEEALVLKIKSCGFESHLPYHFSHADIAQSEEAFHSK